MTEEELPQIDRRRFLRYCLGAAGIGAAAAGGAFVGVSTFVVEPTTVRDIDYLGPRVIGGPAPRPVGLYPLSADAEGYFVIDAASAPTGWSTDWYRYCGHEMAPGLQGDFAPGDERLTYFLSAQKLGKAEIAANTAWWNSRIGEQIKPEHFAVQAKGSEPGIGFRWRSEDADGLGVISGVLIRMDDDTQVSRFSERVKEFLYHAPDGSWYMAINAYCTHFCCVPAFKETDVAKGVVVPGYGEAFDRIFCTCHNSVYDPYDIIEATFELKEPEVEE